MPPVSEGKNMARRQLPTLEEALDEIFPELPNRVRHAREETEKKVDKKWQAVVAEKDTVLAEKDAEIAALRARLKKDT
jgi:hypothetical protein